MPRRDLWLQPGEKKVKLKLNCRYFSINSHGYDKPDPEQQSGKQSRRDDMESLGFSLLELVSRKLPWEGIDSCHQIHEAKQDATESDLYKNFPESLKDAFKRYFEHVRGLRFDEEPKYELLRNLFADIEGPMTRGQEPDFESDIDKESYAAPLQ